MNRKMKNCFCANMKGGGNKDPLLKNGQYSAAKIKGMKDTSPITDASPIDSSCGRGGSGKRKGDTTQEKNVVASGDLGRLQRD